MSCIENLQIYTLRNHKGRTVLDLSSRDNYSITGYNDHCGPNQAWMFERVENGWLIRSASAGQFLGIEGDIRNIQDGTKVVAVHQPFLWHIEDSDIPDVEGIRILARGTRFSVDLSDHGNSTEGTKVELRGRWQGANQIWVAIH